MYDFSLVQAAVASENQTKIGNVLNHDKDTFKYMTGEARVLQLLSTSCFELTLPIKGPSLLRITLPSPDLKPEYPL